MLLVNGKETCQLTYYWFTTGVFQHQLFTCSLLNHLSSLRGFPCVTLPKMRPTAQRLPFDYHSFKMVSLKGDTVFYHVLVSVRVVLLRKPVARSIGLCYPVYLPFFSAIMDEKEKSRLKVVRRSSCPSVLNNEECETAISKGKRRVCLPRL